jgi:hypothetical protein
VTGFLPQGNPQFLPKKPGGLTPPGLCREVTLPASSVTRLKDKVFELATRVDELEAEFSETPPIRR